MAIQAGGAAPYAPPSAVLNIIDRYRNHGLAAPFTLETLQRAGVSESLAPRTLQALRLLDLIADDGNPTEEFVDLSKATSDEYEPRLAALLRAAYADVFSFTDPSTDSVERVEDAFRAYNPRSQRSRMVTLFLGLCRRAGLAPDLERAAPKQRGFAGTGSGSRQTAAPRRAQPAIRRSGKPAASGNTGFDGSIPPILAGIIAQLPEPGSTWTTGQRGKTLNALGAALDLLYDVDDTPPTPPAENGE